MKIRRVVPDLRSADLDAARAFYARLGLEEVMNLGWVSTLASPDNPTAQIILFRHDEPEPQPAMSIEVDDVDGAYAAMRAAGSEIVYELRDEPWGVRRFFVRDPDGNIVNVVGHR
ncbi:VOC family protein [Spirillospora sp. NPDC048911]|uniref:VOC family protein n=1 Tax=Spirillospora sp. NPDC048911 TaxID=3364527 RepID=UPI00372153D3